MCTVCTQCQHSRAHSMIVCFLLHLPGCKDEPTCSHAAVVAEGLSRSLYPPKSGGKAYQQTFARPTCSVVSTSGLAAEVSTPLALSTFSASFRPVCKTGGETLNAGVAVRRTGTHGGRSAQNLLSLLQARLRN